MSELPLQHVEAVNQLVQLAIDRIGEGVTMGTVTVAVDSPAWDSANVWVKGECSECGATSVMRASDHRQCEYLAKVIARYRCPERGHNNEAGH